MFKKAFYFTMLLLVFGEPCLAPKLEAGVDKKPLRIVCTILPVYIFTLNVVGQVPDTEVKLLLPPRQGCPHNYDLTPGDLMVLSRADVIVANGLGMDSFLEAFIRDQRPKVSLIEGAVKIVPLKEPSPPTRQHRVSGRKEHDHADEVNGHAWVSPEKAAIMVETIAEGLARKDALHASEFRNNGRQYAERLRALAGEIKAVVARAGNRKIMAFHDILAYLARDTGLTVVDILEPQLGVEPSSRDMVRLIRTAKTQKIAAIFSEPPYSDKLVRAIAQEAGVPWYPFDPVATGRPAADTYETVMKKNIEILRKALH